MKVELFPPPTPTQSRDIGCGMISAFAMMWGPGSIEWGSKRSGLEKFAYKPGDLALCRPSSGRVGRTDECAASATRHFRCGTDSCI